ncbi:MAG TPA: MlaD family protein [Acidimicrobiales bacterium]|nr:MlaD family protein [Acidimicrobiales bacterium]
MIWKVTKLSAFVAVTVGLTLWIAASIVGVDRGGRYELVARFTDVAGLHGGDPVKLAGVGVGRVQGIDVEQGQAIVRFEVDEDVRLPEDSTVAVRWRNLIGQRYLWLSPGEADEHLADGDTVEDAQDVVDLGQLVNQLAPLAQAVSPEQINRILTALLEAFDGNEATFDGLVRDLDTVLASLAERDDTIAQLLEDYGAIAGAVASRDAQIDQMVQNLVAIASTFSENDALLDRALVELGAVSGSLDQLLSTGAADLGDALDHLAVLTRTAAEDIGSLEAAFANLPGLFEAVFPALNRGEYLRVSVLCLTLQTGQCPYPTTLSGPPGGPPLITNSPGDG